LHKKTKHKKYIQQKQKAKNKKKANNKPQLIRDAKGLQLLALTCNTAASV